MAEECCCSSEPTVSVSDNTHPWIIGSIDADGKQIPKVATTWTNSEWIGVVRCRVSDRFRMKYTIEPGIYAVGNASKNSPVCVTANYKFSFDVLRRALDGVDAWIVILDTKGINVWCAAGKGTFGTDELIKRINRVNLERVVDHRRIILPQLGAPKMMAHRVKSETGFTVMYGPVDAGSVKQYLADGFKASRAMRTARFTFLDRLILTPMEINGALKHYWIFFLLVFAVFGLHPGGIVFKDGWNGGLLFYGMGLVAIAAGGFITPVLLPYIPFRSFAIKGWIIGMLLTALIHAGFFGEQLPNLPLLAAIYLFFPVVSSYLALNFTGCTHYTNPTGVLKEVKYALPMYSAACVLSLVSLVWYKLLRWGIL